MAGINSILTSTRAFACLDCGRCTVSCPVTRYSSDYSPRLLVAQAVAGDTGLLQNGRLWSCVTCSICEERCQSGVHFSELVRLLRAEAYGQGNTGQCTHGGALASLMHIMASGNLKQNRRDWLDKELRASDQSETMYFTGCSPYFDVIFANLGVKSTAIAQSAVKLLNRLGIIPAVSSGERCCGHDLLWSGDMAGFMKLAQLNLAEIKRTGAKKVVTTCPECYLTLKKYYPQFLGPLDFEVVHLSQVISEGVTSGRLNFRPFSGKVTYHDPCRLGRYSGIYEEPRAIIRGIPGLKLVEMPRNRRDALCCGTQAWINCGAVNKQIQNELLYEAEATGAELLVTSCPKCQIHLKCAREDAKHDKSPLEMTDIFSLASRYLAKEQSQ